MTIQDLGSLGEFLGSIAVLVTLVYLALQTRQNTKAISTQLDAARMGAVKELELAPATSSELLEALNTDRIEPLTLEQARLHSYWRARFSVVQWNFNELRRGDVLWLGNEALMSRRVGSFFKDFRSVGTWWESAKPNFLPEFVEWVEEQRAKARQV
jgi:hypothetical protein